jgi:Immunity protein 8
MLSEVKGIMGTQVFDLENYRPDNYEDFSISITVTVGPKGEKAGDNFDIEVCTPKWLLDHRYDDFILGKGKLIVYRCDMIFILAKIRALFEGCIGKDWNEIAIKLSRIGQWEFEDYKPRSV